MAYRGSWGVYVHIPKTGGTFIRRVLGDIGAWESPRVKTHDLPEDWDGEVWTCVREPAEWLASVWAHRQRQAWRKYKNGIPWNYLCNLLADRVATGYWDRFVKRVVGDLPGIVGWFYGIYTPPGVETYRLGPDLYSKLRELGGNPDRFGVMINKGNNVPELTDEQRALIYKAEIDTYRRYGFEEPDHI